MILPRLLGLAAAVSFVLAPAVADVPPAMDRIPGDAAVVVSVKNVNKLKTGIDALAKAIGVPAEEMQGLMKIDQVLKMQGADGDGSAAIGVMNVEGDEPEAVAVIPVKDYNAFVKNFGGTGNGVEELKLDENPVYAKNIEGGFAAVGPNKALVEKFAGKPGGGASHEALLGATGKAIAETSDIVLVANIAKLGDKIKEGTQGFKDQMGMAMAMAGGGGDLTAIDKFTETFIKEAQSGVIGFRIGESGVTVDLGAQFKEGSEYAGYFTAPGKASELLARLPNQQFLFTMAMDTSSPGIRNLLKAVKDMASKMQGDDKGGPGMFPADFADKGEGIAFQLGNSPAPMGGLFLNTVAFIKSSKPDELAKALKDDLTAMNGKTVSGITYTTTYEAAEKGGEAPADSWSMKMQADPEDDNAQMVNQMNFMLFGPSGLTGYAAPTDQGLVLTYAKNADLLKQALASSKGGGANAGSDAEVKAIASNLPAGRSFEGYLGVKSILDTVLGILAPMGVAPNVQVPESIPPVGFGATTQNGGLRFTIVVPTKVITSVKSIAESIDQGGADDMDKPGAGQPKF